jgi:hypothetical protein
MADVRVWSFARTATEMADDDAHALSGNETGLVDYQKLNKDGLVCQTANGNTLSHNGSAPFSTSTPCSGCTETLQGRKAANESVTHSTVLQSDNHLKL